MFWVGWPQFITGSLWFSWGGGGITGWLRWFREQHRHRHRDRDRDRGPACLCVRLLWLSASNFAKGIIAIYARYCGSDSCRSCSCRCPCPSPSPCLFAFWALMMEFSTDYRSAPVCYFPSSITIFSCSIQIHLTRLMLHTGSVKFRPDNLQILASMAMTMIMPTRNFSVVIVSLVTSDQATAHPCPFYPRLAALSPPKRRLFVLFSVFSFRPKKFTKQNFSIYSARWTVRVLVTCISTLTPLRFVPFDGSHLLWPIDKKVSLSEGAGEMALGSSDAGFVTCITMKKPQRKVGPAQLKCEYPFVNFSLKDY